MPSSSFKKVMTMYGATVLSILLGFLISIFNTRILGPKYFGDFKFIETVGRFIASVVSVGFFVSLTRLLAKSTDKTNERIYIGLFVLTLFATSALGIILYVIFSLIEPYFFKNNLDESILKYSFIVVAILGQIAVSECLKGLHRIYTLSFYGFLPSISFLVVIYVYSLYHEVSLDDVIFSFYGINLIFIALLLFILKPDFRINKSRLNELLTENKYNGRPIYFGSLAGVATTHLAGLSISYFMDNTQVGFFMLALTVCSPLLVIPSVLGTVYFKQFVTLVKIPKKVILFSLLCTILALIVFYSLIESVIIAFYTEEYLPVSNISKFLIIAFIFHGLGDLINRFLGAKGEGRLLRNAAFMVGIVNVIGYTVLIKFFSINGAIITKILASGLYLAVMYYYYHNFVKKNKHVPE